MRTYAIAKPLMLPIFAVVVAFGANPVGRLISSAPVDIDGIAAPARNYVPVSVGNEITTKSASAVVQFADGSGVTLQPNSKLRIEGQPSNVSVKVVSGSALYDLARGSKVHVVNSKGETVTAIPDLRPPAANSQVSDSLTPAVVYRGSPARQTGMVIPSSAILIGTFVPSPAAAGGSTGPAILLPNGLTINLTATTTTTGGVTTTTYTVASVTTTVTLPSGATTTLTITSGDLIGDTITPPPAGAQGGVTVTTPSGATVTNPNAVLQNTITTGVTTALGNGTLPTGSTAPTPSPVSTGEFSGSAT